MAETVTGSAVADDHEVLWGLQAVVAAPSGWLETIRAVWRAA
jgi:hypothetical protein